MKLHLFQRRTVWWPTRLGFVALVMVVVVPIVIWWFFGEGFLATTKREPAEILVVEGWIGINGVQAAKAEFERGGYRYILTTGGVAYNNWDRTRWDYAESAREILLKAGMAPDKIVTAQAPETEDHRTFKSALASWRTLQTRGINPKTLNIFSVGAHARRSRLVFAKVYGNDVKVGMVSWTQTDYSAEPWWHSSERADTFIKETVGYLFELILNSGRGSNHPEIDR